MYLLNNKEKAVLKLIIKNSRADFFRKNKYIFVEETCDDNTISSNDIFENHYEIDVEDKIKVNNIEDIFLDEKIYKVIRALTHKEKSLLYFYYVEDFTDKEIAKILNSTEGAINVKRIRTIMKIRKKIKEMVE